MSNGDVRVTCLKDILKATSRGIEPYPKQFLITFDNFTALRAEMRCGYYMESKADGFYICHVPLRIDNDEEPVKGNNTWDLIRENKNV